MDFFKFRHNRHRHFVYNAIRKERGVPMEKVIMEKMRKPFVIRSGDVWCALFALVLGSVQGLMEPILVFLFLTHCYLRSTSETISMILFLFISLLTKDMMYL